MAVNKIVKEKVVTRLEVTEVKIEMTLTPEQYDVLLSIVSRYTFAANWSAYEDDNQKRHDKAFLVKGILNQLK